MKKIQKPILVVKPSSSPHIAHTYLKSLLLIWLLLPTTVVVNVGKKSWYAVALQGSTGQYDLL